MIRLNHILLFLIMVAISIALACFPYITYNCLNCTKDSTSILEIYSETSDLESVAATALLSVIWLPLIICFQGFWTKVPFSLSTKIILWTEILFMIIGWFAGALIMSLHFSPYEITWVFRTILFYEAFFTIEFAIFLMGFNGFGLAKIIFRKT